MATTQFNFYSSADIGSPQLTGLTGSLIDVLDTCLVTGYGTGSFYKAPVGWLKPFPNTSSCGCYKQPSGSLCTVFVNDSSCSAAIGKEAQVTGWDSFAGMLAAGLTSITGSALSASWGSGSGQFPGPPIVRGAAASILWTMPFFYVFRKSATTDTTARPWMVFADAYTLYVFVLTGDSGNPWFFWQFGDILSMHGSNDIKKCIITGRWKQNSAGGSAGDENDVMFYTTYNYGQSVTQAAPAWIVRGVSQQPGNAVPMGRCGDAGKANWTSVSTGFLALAGVLTVPNPADNKIYISPLWMNELNHQCLEGIQTEHTIRGKLRGIWHATGAIANFGDGQILIGTGNLIGKKFRVVKPGYNSGMWIVEISNTVDVN